MELPKMLACTGDCWPGTSCGARGFVCAWTAIRRILPAELASRYMHPPGRVRFGSYSVSFESRLERLALCAVASAGPGMTKAVCRSLTRAFIRSVVMAGTQILLLTIISIIISKQKSRGTVYVINFRNIRIYLMNLIISIKSEFVKKIFNWEKICELRRIFPKSDVNKVIIYESAPISRVVGEFEVEDIFYKNLVDLWNFTKWFSCVDKKFFDEYFHWKEFWYAIKIKNVKKYKTLKMISDYGFVRPPQSYAFLK